MILKSLNINYQVKSVKEYEHVLKVWNKFEMNVERFSRFVFKM